MTKVMIYDKHGERLPDYLAILGKCLLLGCTEINYTIHKIIETRPDVVLADWHDSDGNKLLEEMSKLRENMPPVILISPLKHQARKDEALRIALERGAHGFLSRPFTRQQFYQELVAASERHQSKKLRSASVEKLETNEDDFILKVMAGIPMLSLGDHVGGIGKLAGILARHNVLEHPDNRRKVYKILTEWGKLSPGKQIVEATEFCVSSAEVRKDPVSAAICDLAQEILFGEEVLGLSSGD